MKRVSNQVLNVFDSSNVLDRSKRISQDGIKYHQEEFPVVPSIRINNGFSKGVLFFGAKDTPPPPSDDKDILQKGK
ncbi:MAG: hypothetical protein K2X66_10220, partial [Cyanobacteria bacterium]|nr:hypothetical protein [Cyanobacteriota bacterium]